jgi:hypothetical protein
VVSPGIIIAVDDVGHLGVQVTLAETIDQHRNAQQENADMAKQAHEQLVQQRQADQRNEQDDGVAGERVPGRQVAEQFFSPADPVAQPFVFAQRTEFAHKMAQGECEQYGNNGHAL